MKLFLIKSFASHDSAKSKGLRWLIISSMSVAFTAIIVTASILQGFTNMLVEGELGWHGYLIVQPEKGQNSINNLDKVKSFLNSISEIKSYSVRDYAILNIEYKDSFYQPYASIGVNPDQEEGSSKLKADIIYGNFIDSSRPDEIVVGKMLAQSFKGNPYLKNGERIQVGESVKLYSKNGVVKTYKIAGILDAKTFIPNWLLIMDKKEMETLDDSSKDSEIIINLKNANDLEKVKKQIKDANLGIKVYTWREVAGYADDIITGVSFITYLINALLIATVFIVISIIIFINILQKKRQIGILKSMGADNNFITGAYILETMGYIFWSCIIGAVIFFIINYFSNQYPVSMLIGDFHTVFDWKILINSVAVMFIASMLGTLVPTYLASKIKIADVIRDNV